MNQDIAIGFDTEESISIAESALIHAAKLKMSKPLKVVKSQTTTDYEAVLDPVMIDTYAEHTAEITG